jgi:ribonuclease HII
MRTTTEMTANPLYDFDANYADVGRVVAGIDEAGRGPLAGPVVVAAVILPPEPQLAVNDSKALTEKRRQELAEEIMALPGIRYAICLRSAAQIDEMNILRATHDAMREAALSVGANYALVDGLAVPRFPVQASFIVKGDAKSASIAAASILAKTRRDQILEELEKVYPGYGFAKHKGYGTAEHLEALRKLGPCPEHRKSFRPVAEAAGLLPQQLELSF